MEIKQVRVEVLQAYLWTPIILFDYIDKYPDSLVYPPHLSIGTMGIFSFYSYFLTLFIWRRRLRALSQSEEYVRIWKLKYLTSIVVTSALLHTLSLISFSSISNFWCAGTFVFAGFGYFVGSIFCFKTADHFYGVTER